MSSSSFYSEYGGMFWIGVGGILTGICVASFRACYKCKCSEIGLCFGLVTINRDTEHETDIDKKTATSRAELGIAGSSYDDIPPSGSPSQQGGRAVKFAGFPTFGSGGGGYDSGKYNHSTRKNSSPPQPI